VIKIAIIDEMKAEGKFKRKKKKKTNKKISLSGIKYKKTKKKKKINNKSFVRAVY
jgi:hypothetical protein